MIRPQKQDKEREHFRAAIDAGNVERIQVLIRKGVRAPPLAILSALKRRQAELVPLLKSAGANPDECDALGDTALCYAAGYRTEVEVRLVLEAGANPNQVSALLPLVIASIRGKPEIVKLLLEFGADVNKTQPNGLTALLEAVRTGHIYIVRTLLAAGANPAYVGPQGKDSLELSEKEKHAELTQLLRLSIRKVRKKQVSPTEAMVIAIRDQDQNAVTRLIDDNIDLNATDRFGRRPLDAAVSTNIPWYVFKLLDAGAEPNYTDNQGDSPLTGAVRGQIDPSIVGALLDAGAKPRAMSPRVGQPIVDACIQGQLEVTRLLLKAGANPSARGMGGVTTLMIAVSSRALDLVKLLISNGANVNLEDVQGWTALFYASRIQSMEITKEQLPKGARITSTSPPQAAENPGAQKIIKSLLENGADVNTTDNTGRTPITYANTAGIANLLIKAGARLDVRDKHGHSVEYWLKQNRVSVSNEGRSPWAHLDTAPEGMV